MPDNVVSEERADGFRVATGLREEPAVDQLFVGVSYAVSLRAWRECMGVEPT